MKQEDKELLLKDLCARLPYGVRVQMADGAIEELLNVNTNTFICNGLRGLPKPYLFPLSSMTDEQKEEYENALVYHDYVKGGWTIAKSFNDEYIIPYWFVDFCNKNHLDYRGLIPKGLAIDATGLNIY